MKDIKFHMTATLKMISAPTSVAVSEISYTNSEMQDKKINLTIANVNKLA